MLSLLSELCSISGVSGDEAPAAKKALELLSPLGKTFVNPLGSVICHLEGSPDTTLPKIMLTAHLDQIGLMVTSISDAGFVRTAPCGGIDRRAAAGARVTIHTASGPLKGVVSSVPPHLQQGEQKLPKAEELTVDAGLCGDEAKKLICHGDRITFDGAFLPLLGDSVVSTALDNRAGCAIIIEAARLLKAATKKAHISVALVSQEETGGAGAKTAAFTLDPDYAFVVDVSMGVTPDEKTESCGEMSKGPMVGFSPFLDRSLSLKACEIAAKHQIPVQREVMSGRTGTDSDAVAATRGGVRTALLSIPLRFMHTPCEVIRLEDAQNTAKLIALCVEDLL